MSKENYSEELTVTRPMNEYELREKVIELEGRLETQSAELTKSRVQVTTEMTRGNEFNNKLLATEILLDQARARAEGFIQLQKDVTEARNHIVLLKNESEQIQKNRDEWEKLCQEKMSHINQGLGRERLLKESLNEKTEAINQLKTILFDRELLIATLEGKLQVFGQIEEDKFFAANPTITIPREVWNERNKSKYEPVSSIASGYNTKFGWWNIGKKD